MKKIFFYFLLLASWLSGGHNARAIEYTLEIAIPGAGDTITGADAGAFLAEYLSAILKFSFSVVAFLAVAMIIYGGILYMVPTQTPKAKEKIWGAIIGLTFLMGSFLILRTIDPSLTNLRLSVLEKFNVPNSPHEGFTLTDDQLKSSPIVTGVQYNGIVNDAAAKYDLPPELIKAVILVESNGQSDVCSKNKNGKDMACGLMQLMPGTFKEYCDGGYDSSHRSDPKLNVAAGAKYLAHLIDEYDGDTATALAAYNWGPGNIDKKCDGNIANCQLPQETANYVPKVLKYMFAIKKQTG